MDDGAPGAEHVGPADELAVSPQPTTTFLLGALDGAVADRLQQWTADGFVERLWAHDPALWGATADTPELTNRLGWLDLPEEATASAPKLLEFAAQQPFDHLVLVGMGGSSLAPELYQATFGNAADRPRLIVLDSTHPLGVQRVADAIDPARTLFLVSSKSGTTLETLSFYRYFWERTRKLVDRPGRHFVAVTDPLSKLVEIAAERDFLRVLPANPEVGGRYSALTAFGLAPAALIGVDLPALVAAAGAERSSVQSDQAPDALRLGAAMGEAALAGRDKVTFFVSDELAAFAAWLEQLIAESTGKDGTGIVPIAEEHVGPPDVYGADRLFVEITGGEPSHQVAALADAGHPTVTIRVDNRYDLGTLIYRFEVAVAAAGAVLGINPFDQPDVQLAKKLAGKVMAGGSFEGEVVEHHAHEVMGAAAEWRQSVQPGDYIGIHAYLAPDEDTSRSLQHMRHGLRDRLRVATTLGYGPRFLHSSGQLHKGGPNTGVFLQIVDEPRFDIAVPEADFTFGKLIAGQALGDYHALRERGRRVLRVNVGTDVKGGLEALGAAIGA